MSSGRSCHAGLGCTFPATSDFLLRSCSASIPAPKTVLVAAFGPAHADGPVAVRLVVGTDELERTARMVVAHDRDE